MKNLLLLLSLLFTASVAICQVYRPLPMQNAYWITSGGIGMLSCPACTPIDVMYFTDGDTLINAVSYIKINKAEQRSGAGSTAFYPAYTGAIRQDTLNKKIYVVLTDSTAEKILYDFTMQIGDTIRSALAVQPSDCLGTIVQTVAAIDSISINGNYHKRYEIQGSCAWNLYYIEGIGSTYGLIFPDIMDMVESQLNCVNVNNQTYYPNSTTSCAPLIVSSESLHDLSNDGLMFPNPTSGNITIKSNFNLPAELELYDVTGRKTKTQSITSNNEQIHLKQSAGIYFYRIMQKEKLLGAGKVVVME